jgi:hypothetical protein
MRQRAVHHTYVGDDSPVGVVDRVKDQRSGRRRGITDWLRNLGDDLIQQLRHALTGLCRDTKHLTCVTADDFGQLGGVLIRLRAGQINLVQDWNDVQIGLESQIEIGQSLRLNALRGVNDEHSTLAGG